MPEYDDEIEQQNSAGNWRRQKEQEAADAIARAEAAEALAASGQSAVRELALMRAGIDIESKLGKLFAKAYDGPVDVEAIKAAAIEAEIITAPVPDAEQQAHQRMTGAAAGGGNPSTSEAADVEAQMRDAAKRGDKSALLDIIRANGGAISNEQPGDWAQSPNTYMR